jgi:hypothetical protein
LGDVRVTGAAAGGEPSDGGAEADEAGTVKRIFSIGHARSPSEDERVEKFFRCKSPGKGKALQGT